MTDHRQLPGLGATTVDVPIAAAHRALARAEISARHVKERFAKGRAARLVADERRKDIALLQKQTARRAHRLLSAPDVNAAGDHAATIKTCQFLLENPRLEHPAKRLEIAFVRRRFRFLGCAA